MLVLITVSGSHGNPNSTSYFNDKEKNRMLHLYNVPKISDYTNLKNNFHLLCSVTSCVLNPFT